MKLRSFCGSAVLTVLAAAASVANATVPEVDPVGKPAIVVCKMINGEPVRAVHMDKVIFHLTGELIAANPNDQPQLENVPQNRRLDIKVLDDPRTVADLKAKVLTFLGAALLPVNFNNIVIDDVDYAVVCPNPEPAGGG